MITDFGTLELAVLETLARDDLEAFIPLFIQRGEMRINRQVRVRQMEVALDSTIASGVIVVPTDYIELKFSYVDGTPTQSLTRLSLNEMFRQYPLRSSDSKPRAIARETSNFVFGPWPDSAYTIKGSYYAEATALTAQDDTNWMITDAPDLIYFASLLGAESFIKNDSRIAVWEQAYFDAKKQLDLQTVREEGAGSALRARSA